MSSKQGNKPSIIFLQKLIIIILYKFSYFADDTSKVSWGQGIILAKKDGNADERVADHSAHVVKHVHRN